MSNFGASQSNDAGRVLNLTLGTSKTGTVWSKRWTGTWPDLVALLTDHKTGQKDGPCIVPATLREPTRRKEFAEQIDVAFLDSDTGIGLDEIVSAIGAQGWEAVVSSTHSHLTTWTKVRKTNWDKFFADNQKAIAADLLQQQKDYLANVAEGAEAIESDDDFVTIQHQPCPKFRIAIPLRRPWHSADYPSQDAANAAWKERVEALAAALRLQHDQSCTDTSRLFYLPRRPADGPPPETQVIDGERCDLFTLPACAPGLFAAGTDANQPGTAKPARRAAQVDGGGNEYIDPETGEVIDLRIWARQYGGRFKIVAAIRARRPSMLTGKVADRVKVHLRCSNEDAHTEVCEDGATFVVNAGEAGNRGFVYHCRHGHCDGKDRLFSSGACSTKAG